MKLSYFSLTTFPLTVLAENGTELGKATGFFYRSGDDKVYLITNWHVITGRDPVNPQITKNGAIPCKLRCHLHTKQEDQNAIRLSQTESFDLQVNNEEGTDPTWQEHPIHKHNVDVIAVEIENIEALNDKFVIRALNDYKNFEPRYIAEPMDTVYVIGYPWSLTGGSGALPLFKRGSIASEPIVNQDGLPKMLIDCRTSSAMSGSPVLVSHSGIWNPNGGMSADSVLGTLVNFIGIYSGRMNSKENQEISEIGIVWKQEVIDEIINNEAKGYSL